MWIYYIKLEINTSIYSCVFGVPISASVWVRVQVCVCISLCACIWHCLCWCVRVWMHDWILCNFIKLYNVSVPSYVQMYIYIYECVCITQWVFVCICAHLWVWVYLSVYFGVICRYVTLSLDECGCLVWFGLVLWHINHCRLFNTKSIFIQLISSILNSRV